MYPWGDARPYHSYAAYCRRTFGRPIQKLPVDGGFTCPNRDGTVGHGGCSFCSNEAFTPAYCDPRRTVRQQVDDAIAFHRRGFPAGTGFLVYFQSYSNTYAPLERLQRLFGEALACPGVAGIVVGTRPDCVDAAKLDYLADLARRTYVCVEYGIESTSDATLRTIDRGHDFAAARRAVEATAARGVAVGALHPRPARRERHGAARPHAHHQRAAARHGQVPPVAVRRGDAHDRPLRRGARAVPPLDGRRIRRPDGRNPAPPAARHRRRTHRGPDTAPHPLPAAVGQPAR